jgi:hypothetical protein
MKPQLNDLSPVEQKELLDDLNYLNVAEIRSFCRRHSIPFTIHVEGAQGSKTHELDRKGVILNRIRHFLMTGVVLPPTRFPAKVVRFVPLPKKPSPNDRLYYGQYQKNNRAMMSLLKSLSRGKFCEGATARIVAREFWSKGQAPTFREYVAAWLTAEEGGESHPEWAFLADLAHGTAGSDWKLLRTKKAAKVMRLLNSIEP